MLPLSPLACFLLPRLHIYTDWYYSVIRRTIQVCTYVLVPDFFFFLVFITYHNTLTDDTDIKSNI